MGRRSGERRRFAIIALAGFDAGGGALENSCGHICRAFSESYILKHGALTRSRWVVNGLKAPSMFAGGPTPILHLAFPPIFLYNQLKFIINYEDFMDVSKISVGKNAPEQVNVVIEVPANADPIKYEFDKEAGAIVVDRFLSTPMRYPCNYGFVPGTLSGDGDPADVLVLAPYSLVPGCVIAARPVGVLIMEDEAGQDEKILAVPSSKLTKLYDDITTYEDLPQALRDQIKHFFEHYKDLEKGKWVKVTGWEGPEKAKALLQEAIDNAGKKRDAA
jgi:inorganic pyrophosphatase